MSLLRIDNEIVDESVQIKEGETLSLNWATFENGKPCKLEVKVFKNAIFNMAFADFGSWDGQAQITVELMEEGAEFNFHCASLSSVNQNKTIRVDCIHRSPRTHSLISNYGIASDDAQIHFEGSSHILRGSIGSYTRQEAKAILFDALSQGYCSPVLKIDENDIEASHAASVGRVNDDHLFYMLSRGLSKEEARKIIIMGYLKPIAAYFDEDEMKERIANAIEERI